MMLHFQSKIIRFTLTKTLSFDKKLIEAKKEDVKIKTGKKWKYWESIPLQYLLNTYHRVPLWNMAKNMVMSEN